MYYKNVFKLTKLHFLLLSQLYQQGGVWLLLHYYLTFAKTTARKWHKQEHQRPKMTQNEQVNANGTDNSTK